MAMLGWPVDHQRKIVKVSPAATGIPLQHNIVGSYNEVPNLAWRSLSSKEEVIDDKTLSSMLFTAGESFDIVSSPVDAETISCGAKRKIWMNATRLHKLCLSDTLPEADGLYHWKDVCITDAETNDPCKDTFAIEVHNGGNFRVYALELLRRDQYGLENDTVAYCFDLSIPGDPCSDWTPPVLPGLEYHRPVNTYVTQTDDSLVHNWYSAKPYQMVTESPDLDLTNRCGANSQMWMNDSLPEADGKHHIRKLCVTDFATSRTCADSIHYTFIKNCGRHYVYFLTSSPKHDSAYCFDIPSVSGDPAPDFTPSNVQIKTSLKWIPYGLTSFNEMPNLQFHCSFDENNETDLFYSVYFYVNGDYLDTDIIIQDPSYAFVTDLQLQFLGYAAGITISCHVGARSSRDGSTGITTKSPGFYAGIKMLNSSIDVKRGEKGVVSFYPTIPYGCVKHSTNPESTCQLTLYISSDAANNICDSNSIQHQCTVEVAGVTKDNYNSASPWTSETNYEFEIATSESKQGSYYLANSKFVLKLQTKNPSHQFWKNIESETVTINVSDTEGAEIWQGKVCSVHCDPHHLTFDGLRFELQKRGRFLLMKTEDPPMQVHLSYAVTDVWLDQDCVRDKVLGNPFAIPYCPTSCIANF
ncbi:uncharacterized protein LOC132553681 [Ylistrum balloti]|uniref:uncharacterized protein LOC132553681 n=1 Tax=Ylistrum balloti TaxID=509963 RepID=UPI0029058EE5|nr:uncharacterized protein LOC132553681 [Ylistrum balloti]